MLTPQIKDLLNVKNYVIKRRYVRFFTKSFGIFLFVFCMEILGYKVQNQNIASVDAEAEALINAQCEASSKTPIKASINQPTLSKNFKMADEILATELTNQFNAIGKNTIVPAQLFEAYSNWFSKAVIKCENNSAYLIVLKKLIIRKTSNSENATYVNLDDLSVNELWAEFLQSLEPAESTSSTVGILS